MVFFFGSILGLFDMWKFIEFYIYNICTFLHVYHGLIFKKVLKIWNSELEPSNSQLVYSDIWASFVAQSVKNLPAVQETWVWSLGWEDPLEKEMASHSSIIAW